MDRAEGRLRGGPLFGEQRGRLLPSAVPIFAQVGNHRNPDSQPLMRRLKTCVQLADGRSFVGAQAFGAFGLGSRQRSGGMTVQLRTLDQIHPSF